MVMIVARQFAPQTTEGITRRRRGSGAARKVLLIPSILLRTLVRSPAFRRNLLVWRNGSAADASPWGGTTNCAFSLFQGVAARHEGSSDDFSQAILSYIRFLASVLYLGRRSSRPAADSVS